MSILATQCLSYFDSYKTLSGSRFTSFKKALELLFARTNYSCLIVETGTIRGHKDWGAGCSTRLFGEFVHKFGGRFITVDASSKMIKLSKSIMRRWPHTVEWVCQDSVQFLQTFKGTIDLLYLDSLDYKSSDPLPAQNHALEEIKAALPILTDTSIVLIDDNNDHGGGKSKLAKAFLIENGWIELINAKQSLLVRC